MVRALVFGGCREAEMITKPAFELLKADLLNNRSRWLVTGAAGFIGSHLVESLLCLDQEVVGLDNFSTGHQANLDDVQALVSPERWSKFSFVEADIRDLDVCKSACKEVDYVLHQAALGSVPRSINDPVTSNLVNVNGFLNMLVAARDAKVKKFVYAASSSTYGDLPDLPKIEERIGNPLSPYAVTKYVNELYAKVFTTCYGLDTVGLRYFNVFGPRQDPNGAYAAVIPRWINSMMRGLSVVINGDGSTSRDFCFVDNAVQGNLLAAVNAQGGYPLVFNIACSQQTSLISLHDLIRLELESFGKKYDSSLVAFGDFRPGDVKHSLASIERAAKYLGYAPSVLIGEGISRTVRWFVSK
jgi:UDP-N-acetylglucosamine 4-epimerase